MISLTKAQRSLLLLFASFLVPLLIAILMHSQWWDYKPANLRNYGVLLEPPVRFDSSNLAFAGPGFESQDLAGKWWLMTTGATSCTTDCLQRLAAMRQIRHAMGKDHTRLGLLFVSQSVLAPENSSEVRAIDPGLVLATDPADELPQALRDHATEPMMTNGETYLLDPFGNIILAYARNSDPNGIKKDLNRLLTWSKADNS